MKMLLLIFSFLSSQQITFAKPIVYERGGATDSIGIVDEGALHLELGFVGYDQNFSPEQHSFALAPALFRWGLVQDRFELRLSGSGLLLQNDDLSYQNMTIGTKTALYHNHNKQFHPRLNMVSNFTIPTANTGDGTERRFDYFNKFILEQSLTKKVDLLLSFGPDFTRIKNIQGEYNAVSFPWVVSLTHKTTQRFYPFCTNFWCRIIYWLCSIAFGCGYGNELYNQ